MRRREMTDHRRAMLAKIHIAKGQLGLPDEFYRDILFERFGVASSSELDGDGLHRLLLHFQSLGWQAKSTRARKRDRGVPTGVENKDSYFAAIEAALAEIGTLQERHVPWSYAAATLKRMCGVERLEWATPRQLRDLVAALAIRARKLERAAMRREQEALSRAGGAAE